jgi:beta-phosphoglucomutase-like phosphatase (HAD superfamily)
MTVPGTRELLESLQRQGIALYLASGTDLKYVQDEVQVLGLADYFGEHVYGALDDYRQFSKAMIVERIIRETQMPGKNLVGFGDGFVEIEEVARVGGLAIGVASNEDTRKGVNAWKRQRLIQAGAHLIIGDYRGLPELLAAMGLSG